MSRLDNTALISALPADCREAAQLLNRGCACLSVDHDALAAALAHGGEPLRPQQLATRPHLFSDSLVFVADAHLAAMAALVAAVDSVVALPGYRERVLAWAPAIAGFDPGPAGVFLGYDFHLGAAGPQLIEINTNAGGGLLNTKLLSAQRACCASLAGLLPSALAAEAAYLEMFRAEWRAVRGEVPLTRIAIVDDAPHAQYLAPEFELFRRLFAAHGIAAEIADPGDLSLVGERLLLGGKPVDLVYNRLTDFALDERPHAVLREAYLSGAAVVTPHPRAHALYADKRNLAVLGESDWLAGIGASAEAITLLQQLIPQTVVVPAGAAGEAFWGERKRWFFKPFAGYGSKAAYRGDKLTRRVFEEIRQGGYIAQAIVPPSERRLDWAGVPQEMKLDLRNYVYRDRVQLVAARLYQGQTTNFRTPGGGFAAVFGVRCADSG